jgi:hypothetical protein
LKNEAYVGEELIQAEIVLEALPGNGKADDTPLAIFPNPVTAEVNLVFHLNKAQPYSVLFYDASGRLLGKKELEGIEGAQHLVFRSTDLGVHEGLVICQLEANGTKTVQRMVVLK